MKGFYAHTDTGLVGKTVAINFHTSYGLSHLLAIRTKLILYDSLREKESVSNPV